MSNKVIKFDSLLDTVATAITGGLSSELDLAKSYATYGAANPVADKDAEKALRKRLLAGLAKRNIDGESKSGKPVLSRAMSCIRHGQKFLDAAKVWGNERNVDTDQSPAQFILRCCTATTRKEAPVPLTMLRDRDAMIEFGRAEKKESDGEKEAAKTPTGLGDAFDSFNARALKTIAKDKPAILVDTLKTAAAQYKAALLAFNVTTPANPVPPAATAATPTMQSAAPFDAQEFIKAEIARALVGFTAK